MENTFTEVVRKIEIENESDYFYLILFGDTHADTPNHDRERMLYFLKKAADFPKDKTYYIGLGDYNDFMSTSEKMNVKGKVHESTVAKFDQIAEKANRDFAKICKQMIGRTLGLIEGNHNWVFSDGKTSGEDLAERLKTECIGGMSHMTLNVYVKSRRKDQKLFISLHHGKGAGKLAGSTINNVEELKTIFPVSDICAMGHDHKRGVVPVISLIPNATGKLKQKRCMLVRTGCFLASYKSNEQSYAVKRLYRPTDMGGIVLKVSFHRDRKDMDTIITDIEAII